MKSATTLRAITVVGVASLFLSPGVYAQSAQSKPGGGTPTPQDVNVVNTPTVNIGSGGPIGVDVLTLPSQPLPVAVAENPKSVAEVLTVPSCPGDSGVLNYSPPAGKRVVIKSILISKSFSEIAAELHYSGGFQFLRSTVLDSGRAIVDVHDATIALPEGPFSIYVRCAGTIPSPAPVLITFYEVPAS